MKPSLLSLAFLLLFTACRKDHTNLVLMMPAKTQAGKQTLGFFLNADVWTNYGQVCNIGGCHENIRGYYYRSDGDISIGADKVIRRKNLPVIRESFSISLTTNFRGIGQYQASAGDTASGYYRFEENGQPEKDYIPSQNHPDFSITLTKIDTVNNILSGEFSGTLFRRTLLSTYVTSATDSVMIKDGRFDIKMK